MTHSKTVVPLRTGSLDLLYEDGALRLIRSGDFEIIRSMYAAIRDPDWLTVPAAIVNERISQNFDCFTITYERRYDWNGIQFEMSCETIGNSNSISFEMRGTALGTFSKNRIGLCVLHPLRECVGKPCTIVTTGGDVECAEFPRFISPYQPFRNVREMRWQPIPGFEAVLQFDGEVFETEDQRNWTDASFKTYGTPLDLPYPAEVRKGDTFHQRVTLQVTGETGPQFRPEVVSFRPLPSIPILIPPLGLVCSSNNSALRPRDIAVVHTIGLSHLRAELHLSDTNCVEALRSASSAAASLDLPLELVLFFGRDPDLEWQAICDDLAKCQARIRSVMLLHRDHKVTLISLIDAIEPLLRNVLPELLVGGGTDANFAELNRNRPESTALDFLCFSANPQVHANDDRTLLENVSALSDIVKSAREFAGKRAVHVSPLTLKRRSNPDATSHPVDLTEQVEPDPRQSIAIGAVWLLGSLKYLLEAAVDSLTVGEISGPHGIVSEHGGLVPMGEVLREVFRDTAAQIIPSASSDPLRVEGIVITNANGPRFLIANFSAVPQTVSADWGQKTAKLRFLTNNAAGDDHKDFVRDDGNECLEFSDDRFVMITLPAYTIAILETEGGSA